MKMKRRGFLKGVAAAAAVPTVAAASNVDLARRPGYTYPPYDEEKSGDAERRFNLWPGKHVTHRARNPKDSMPGTFVIMSMGYTKKYGYVARLTGVDGYVQLQELEADY